MLLRLRDLNPLNFLSTSNCLNRRNGKDVVLPIQHSASSSVFSKSKSNRQTQQQQKPAVNILAFCRLLSNIKKLLLQNLPARPRRLYVISTQTHKRLSHMRRPCRPSAQRIHRQHWPDRVHWLPNWIWTHRPLVEKKL